MPRVHRERMLTRTHFRLHCPPLLKFHSTRFYSSKKVKVNPPSPSQLKDKKATSSKRNERKRSRNESLPASIKLSSLLRRHNQSARHKHAAGGESTRSRTSLNETQFPRSLKLAILNDKLLSASTGTKWVAHPRASENDDAGGSP